MTEVLLPEILSQPQVLRAVLDLSWPKPPFRTEISLSVKNVLADQRLWILCTVGK